MLLSKEYFDNFKDTFEAEELAYNIKPDYTEKLDYCALNGKVDLSATGYYFHYGLPFGDDWDFE